MLPAVAHSHWLGCSTGLKPFPRSFTPTATYVSRSAPSGTKMKMALGWISSLLLPMAREVKNFDEAKTAFFAQRSQAAFMSRIVSRATRLAALIRALSARCI